MRYFSVLICLLFNTNSMAQYSNARDQNLQTFEYYERLVEFLCKSSSCKTLKNELVNKRKEISKEVTLVKSLLDLKLKIESHEEKLQNELLRGNFKVDQIEESFKCISRLRLVLTLVNNTKYKQLASIKSNSKSFSQILGLLNDNSFNMNCQKSYSINLSDIIIKNKSDLIRYYKSNNTSSQTQHKDTQSN